MSQALSDKKQVSILIMEDNMLTRTAIRAAVERVEKFKVIDEAGDGESALQKLVAIHPDVLLADIELPGVNGIAVTQQVKARWPQIRVIMLTASDNDQDILNSFEAGADGYVIKEGFHDRLEEAITQVSDGMTWLDPRIALCVLKVASQSSQPLSPHESDVLSQVVADGSSCKDGVCSIDPDFIKKLHRFAAKKAD